MTEITTYDEIMAKSDQQIAVEALSADLHQAADLIVQYPQYADLWAGMFGHNSTYCFDADLFRQFVGDMASELSRDKWSLARGVKKEYHTDSASVVGWVNGVVLRLFVDRAGVCEKIVRGQKTIMVADPNAPKVEKLVDEVEWICRPLSE